MQLFAACGGVVLFAGGTYEARISTPASFVLSTPVVARVPWPQDDLSDSWYVLADCGGSQLVSVDLAPERLGRCYDSFWDRHAVAGSSTTIALSVREFLWRLARGESPYWLEPNFRSHGDAYSLNEDLRPLRL